MRESAPRDRSIGLWDINQMVNTRVNCFIMLGCDMSSCRFQRGNPDEALP